MNFLNAILLAGAAAFLIPLIIHLLNKRRVQTVRWGAMHLLHEALRQRKRNLKIEQLLLLIARISIPIVLALCLARPVFSFLRQLPGNQNSLVVVLDNSFSMRATAPGGGTVRDAMRDDLRRILENLPRGTDVSVVLAGSPPRLLLDQPTTVMDVINDKLRSDPSLAGPLALHDAMQLATAQLQHAGSAGRELLLMSDFQQKDWAPVAENGVLPGLDVFRKDEPSALLTFYRKSGDLRENLSIASVEPSAFVVARGQTIGLRVRVRNHGTRAFQDVALHLEADGARLRTTRLSVPAGGETVLMLSHAFDTAGDHALTVRLEGDAFPEDNVWPLVIPVREQVNCLLVSGTEHGGALQGATDFLQIALTPHESASASLKDVIHVSTVDDRRLTERSFGGQEVVVLADVPRLNARSRMMTEMEDFVWRGGGLIIFAGPSLDMRWYDQDFFRNGKGLFPCKFAGAGHVDEGQPPARILSQRYTHPALSYFNEARGLRLQDGAFQHWLRFDKLQGDTHALLTLDRGDALVVEKPFGKGRVIAIASTANADWNSLPLQPVFVPLMQRLVTYLATQNAAAQSSLCGTALRVNLPPEQATDDYVLTDPLNQLHDLSPQKDNEGIHLDYPDTSQPGVYELRLKRAPKEEPRRFAFHLDPAESDLAPLPASKARDIALHANAGYAESFDEYAQLDRTRRHGAEIWQPMLLALLGLMFAEVFLQQRISRDMNHDTTETLLRFTGNWPMWPVLGAACLLASLMFFFYRRELRMHTGPARWVPALLRSLAVFVLVLALAGPILRHVTTFRQLGRVVLAVDASASMSYADEEVNLNNKSPSSAATMHGSQSRFALVEKALLDPKNSLVRKISQKHDVELVLLRGSKILRLWWRREDGADTSGVLPAAFGVPPDATVTNLDGPLREALGPDAAGAALVVFSDGQHNAAGSPEELATAMRDSGVPIFTVGCGSEIPPPDLALVNILAPEAVFSGDRAEGTLVISDTLPPNLHGEASISYQSQVLWHQDFTTSGMGERRFDFSFPAQALAKTGNDGAQTLRLLSVRAELIGNDSVHDQLPDNNRRTLALHLLSRKRRVLILDGRSRWETRYLKNHFERDERWKVTAGFDDFEAGAIGDVEKAFPKTKEDLMSYDLIVLGDLRPEALTPDQQGMIEEFVNARGGGLILVDGRRNHLRDWLRTKAAPLLPVTWTDQAAPTARESFVLTEEGQSLAALRMSDSASVNPAQWAKLPGVYWCASVRPEADATVLAGLSDVVGSGGKLFTSYKDAGANYRPAIVWRRYGAGSVLWSGTDEFWRWRYEVADQHHRRFWMQIASWIAAPPFLIEDKHVSLGTDKLRYEEGGTAELRVRVRNEKGAIITDAQPRAHVLRNGVEIATLEMEPDTSHGGVFRAITGELPAGDYRVTVSGDHISTSEDARLDFRVESMASQEWAQLSMNRPLLESMAQRSGGRFLRLPDASQLPDMLQTLDREETRVTETLLWSSWWWFGAVVVLLTTEWLLRKKWRLV